MITKTAWLALTLLLSSLALAQETVIYQFGAAGPNDGAGPNGGLVFDAAGNMYGTTIGGGSAAVGTVFELSPLQDGTWQETILYTFCPGGIYNSCPDGRDPNYGLVFDATGNLYGETLYGGVSGVGYGTVFELSPPSQLGGTWTEQVLWSFQAYPDGEFPYGGLTIDAAGNLYGTTSNAGAGGFGMVFELSPGENGWTESVLYNFCPKRPDCSDGAQPLAGVTFDKAGNLYGTTMFGGMSRGDGWGVVYELSRTQSGWIETVLKAFNSNTGGRTTAGVTFDPAGNLYGGLSENGCGRFFRLKPFVLFAPAGGDWCSPDSDLVYHAKAMYGSTRMGGINSQGALFKFTQQGTRAVGTVLYDFCKQVNCADGSLPVGPPTLRNGQIYGATAEGGLSEFGGVIYRIAE